MPSGRDRDGIPRRWALWPRSPRTTMSCRGTLRPTAGRVGRAGLPPEDVALAAWIGSAMERPRSRIDADGHHTGAHRKGPEDAELVASSREVVADILRHPVFYLEHPWLALVIVEGAERVQGVEPRRLDSLLQI